MPTRRVINDSEDEDADFSPINSPVKDRVDTTVGAIALEGDAGVELPLADSTIDQRSTDPEFFHKIYEEQQHVPEAARNNRVEGISDKQKSSDPNAKNSSSITDPTRKDSRKKPKTAVDARNFASLTQVTTPRKDGSSGSRMDVYEFPSSDGEGGSARPNTNSRTTKTYGKRKRRQTGISGADIPSSSPAHPSASKQGLSLTHTRDEEEALPKPARKKRGSGTQKALDSLDEDVDLLVVPRTAETNHSPSQPQDSNEGQDVVVPDSLNQPQDTANQAAASFFIAPPNHFTVSQKQEYLPMSGSSEHDDHTSRENALPLPHPETQAQRLRSSEATIAYTTPSRYCSSAPGFPELPEDDGRNSSVLTTSISRKAQKSTVDYNAVSYVIYVLRCILVLNRELCFLVQQLMSLSPIHRRMSLIRIPWIIWGPRRSGTRIRMESTSWHKMILGIPIRLGMPGSSINQDQVEEDQESTRMNNPRKLIPVLALRRENGRRQISTTMRSRRTAGIPIR